MLKKFILFFSVHIQGIVNYGTRIIHFFTKRLLETVEMLDIN